MRRLAALLLLAVFLGACAAPPRPPPTKPSSQPSAPPDRATAEAEIAVIVRESYRLLAQGYDNVYLDGLAHDPRLVLIDVGPDEIQVGFDENVAAARRLFHDDDLYELWSKHLEISVAADGSSAWTHDDLSYRVLRGRRRATVPLRATAVYERRDGRWTKTLEHVSIAVPAAVAAARATAIEAALESETAGEAAGNRVREVVLASLSATSAAESDALFIGVAPGDETRGAHERLDAEVTALRVEVGRTGTVAWAAGLVRLHPTEGAFAARATWVLELRGGDWHIVQTHVSAPVSERTLALEVFGEAPLATPSGPPSPK